MKYGFRYRARGIVIWGQGRRDRDGRMLQKKKIRKDTVWDRVRVIDLKTYSIGYRQMERIQGI